MAKTITVTDDDVEFDDEIEEKPRRKRFVYDGKDEESDAEEPPELEVELGGTVYLANCPNDYDFLTLVQQFREIKTRAYKVNIGNIVGSFFDPMTADEIDQLCRGGKHAKIRQVELFAAIAWLIDEYEPFISEQFKEANRATRRAKKSPASRRGGRAR